MYFIKKNVNELNQKEYRELYLNSSGNLKHNIDSILYKFHLVSAELYELYSDDHKLLAAAKCSFSNKFNLYNIFSLQPGCGSLMLNEVWKDAVKKKCIYYRIWVHLDAIKFYDKFDFRYWDYHLSSKCLLSVGQILDENILESNKKFNLNIKIVDSMMSDINKAISKCITSRSKNKLFKTRLELESVLKERQIKIPSLEDFML